MDALGVISENEEPTEWCCPMVVVQNSNSAVWIYIGLIINLNESVQSEHLFLHPNSRTNFSSGTEVIRNTVASLLMFERCDKCCNYAVSWICQKLKFSLSLEKYVLGSSAWVGVLTGWM